MGKKIKKPKFTGPANAAVEKPFVRKLFGYTTSNGLPLNFHLRVDNDTEIIPYIECMKQAIADMEDELVKIAEKSKKKVNEKKDDKEV